VIQRWGLKNINEGVGYTDMDMVEDVDGMYVKYSDHEAIVKELVEALALACQEVEETFGTCPNDQFDWEGPNCTNEKCRDIDQIGKCWREYYIAKAKGVS
jgi:hypothetical protein